MYSRYRMTWLFTEREVSRIGDRTQETGGTVNEVAAVKIYIEESEVSVRSTGVVMVWTHL